MVDNVGTTKFTWTAGDQLATEDGPWASDTVTNTYNNRFRNALSLQQPTGTWTNGFGFDEHARLTNVISPAGASAYQYRDITLASGDHTASDLVARLNLPNLAYITNNHDGLARLLSTALNNSVNWTLNSHDYVYNDGSQRTRQTFTDSSHSDYTYDNLSQLTVADSTVASEKRGYFYDAAWNLNRRTNNGVATAFSVDRKDELTNAFGAAYSYDNNGNLTSGTNAHQSYLYDDENQLAQWFSYLFSTNSLSGGDLRTDFVYDGQGRLRKRLEYVWNSGGGGPVFLTPSWQLVSETHYIYDGLRVIQERNGSNTPTVSYTRGSDLSGGLEGAGGIGGLLARSHGYSGGTWTTHNFYHADGNGNITYMVNSSQSSVATYKYDPFGNLISSSGTLAGANVYRFSSKEQHANSGMYYYAYRFYDPNLQRWLNRDPIDEDGGINLYRFVGNSSLTWVDPFGLVLRIDPSAPAEFRDHMRDCIKNLINNSPTGKQLVKEAIDDPHTITIAPDPGGAQTIGSVKSKDDRVWPQNPTVNMHPKMPNGMAPDDYRQAKRVGEAPPNDLNGCGVSLAHELGHAVHDYNEPDNIRKVENPVRQDFNLEPRKTYHGIPILEKL